MTKARRRRTDESGFTLIELIVAVAILGTITSTVAGALILGLRTTDDISSRMADSFGSQLLARYLVPDVQSASSHDVKASGSFTLITGCGDTSTDVLRLLAPAVSGAGGVTSGVRYELRSAATGHELVRHRCTLTPASSSSTVVAREVSTATASVAASSAAGGTVIRLSITTVAGQTYVVTSQPRPGRLIALPPTPSTPPPPTAGPALTALEAFDDNADGFIEKIVAAFDAPIRCTGGACSPSAWPTQGQGPSGASIGSVTVAGSVATLHLTGHSSTRSTAISSGYRISLSAGLGGIEAGSAPHLGATTPATAPVDRARPVLVGLGMFDGNANGKVDRLDATFTESLAASSDATVWSLTGTPSGGGRGALSTSGPLARLVVTEGAGPADTAVGNLRVGLVASATGVRDGTGNQAWFVDAVPSDNAAPVALAVASANGATTAGFVEQNDTVTITFSEAIVGAPTTTNAALTADRGNKKPVILTLPGIGAAGFAIGETPSYLDQNSNDVLLTSSTVTVAGSTLQIRLAAPSGGSRTEGAFVTGNTGAYAPAAGLRDAAGNQAVGSVGITVRFF